VLLNKTWREMRATREDFRKVFDVVREQIEKALSSDRPKTFDQFRTQVSMIS
jgi:engulfment and cell motility protein 1